MNDIEIITQTLDNERKLIPIIIEEMNKRFKNEEQFSMQLGIICTEIAVELGLLFEEIDNKLVFTDKRIKPGTLYASSKV